MAIAVKHTAINMADQRHNHAIWRSRFYQPDDDLMATIMEAQTLQALI